MYLPKSKFASFHRVRILLCVCVFISVFIGSSWGQNVTQGQFGVKVPCINWNSSGSKDKNCLVLSGFPFRSASAFFPFLMRDQAFETSHFIFTINATKFLFCIPHYFQGITILNNFPSEHLSRKCSLLTSACFFFFFFFFNIFTLIKKIPYFMEKLFKSSCIYIFFLSLP